MTRTVCEGETVILNSSFVFSHFVEVSWKIAMLDNHGQFEDATNGIYNPCDFTYTIRDVTESDSEVYIPTAVNPEESTPENGASINLKVMPKPS